MPRPPSDLKPTLIRLAPGHLAALDRIAEALGLRVAAGASVGGLDRTQAARRAIEAMDKRLARKAAKPR